MLLTRYRGPGCYRFINEYGKVIYVGSAKNIDRRVHSHFSKSGHLPKECYQSVARIEVLKCESYGKALDLEQYLINKYKPHYNKRDKSHNINSRVVKDEEEYDKLEHWRMYYKFKEFKQLEAPPPKTILDRILVSLGYALLLGGIVFYILK